MEGIHSKEDILLSRSKFERILKARNFGLRDHDISGNTRKKWKPEVGHFGVEKVRKYRDVIYKRFTASVTFARDDKSIADISQVLTIKVRKRKCSVKVEIPLRSEVILEETIDSMDSQDANYSTVEDFKCEMECEQVSQEQIVLEEEPQGQNSPIKLKESVSVVEVSKQQRIPADSINIALAKITPREKQIDSRHFIFDEKFPIERVNLRTWKCETCGLCFRGKRKMDAHILSSECTRIWGHIEENDDDSWRNVNVSPLSLFSAEQTVKSEVLSQPLGKDADADIDSNFQKVIVGPINSTSREQTVASEDLSKDLPLIKDFDARNCSQKLLQTKINKNDCLKLPYSVSSEDYNKYIEHQNEAGKNSIKLKSRKSNPGKHEVDRENFIAPKKAQLERPPDSEDYHPLSSGSSEESVKDPESDNPSKNEDISSDAGHRSNSQLKKQERTERPLIFQKWKLAHRMRQLDATHFIFDDNDFSFRSLQ